MNPLIDDIEKQLLETNAYEEENWGAISVDMLRKISGKQFNLTLQLIINASDDDLKKIKKIAANQFNKSARYEVYNLSPQPWKTALDDGIEQASIKD